jgi:hypothetical protein
MGYAILSHQVPNYTPVALGMDVSHVLMTVMIKLRNKATSECIFNHHRPNNHQRTCAQISQKTSQAMDMCSDQPKTSQAMDMCSDQSNNITGNGHVLRYNKRNIKGNKACAQNKHHDNKVHNIGYGHMLRLPSHCSNDSTS